MDVTVTRAANLTFDLPEGWFVLEADPSARRAALQADVERWESDASDRVPHRSELVEILWGFGADADAKGALFAAVFWETGEYGPVAANLMAFEGLRSVPDDIEAEVATALRDLAEPNPSDHGPREVSEAHLPIGPAARVRFLASSPADTEYSGVSGPVLVLDATQVWIPLAGALPMLIISGTTPCLIAGDDLAAVVDAVAASLRYVSTEPRT